MLITRTHCVICDNELSQITELHNHVLSFSPTIKPCHTNETVTIPIGYCNKCYSLQCMKLIPPDVLYKDSHNETFHTPTWKEHHSRFYDFFKDTLIHMSTCIEIGGAQCILANKIMQNHTTLQYSILDMIEQSLTNIDVQIGNCEEYAFFQDGVILSHVFEHLHQPLAFLENIKKSSVNYIIISVPNLEYLLEQNNLNIVNIEHTFYYNKMHLNYLFNHISFSCIKHEEFNHHSLFYIFKRDPNRIDAMPEFTCNEKLITYYETRDDILHPLDIPIYNDIWIAPAGIYGYTIYSYLIKKGHTNRIKAFIDNDQSKQNKYLSGTCVPILPYSTLCNQSNITVILYGGIYTKEILSQITLLNNKVDIITI
jgi:hypothetical protein